MSDEMKIQTKGFNKKFLFAAIALVAVGLVVALVLLIPTSSKAKKVEEQLDLGAKYLSELNYEQAIVAYEAVIKIDPKCEEAYLALVDVYIATGEFEKAEEILKQAEKEIGSDVTEAVGAKKKEVEAGKDAQEKAELVPSPTEAPTVTPTPIPSPTEIPTMTPTVTPTNTLVPSSTVAPTATPTPSEVPTSTPTPLPTEAPEVTPTEVPTSTPTVTPTPRPTNTPTVTPTPRPTSAPTVTPTPTPAVEGGIVTAIKLTQEDFTYGTYDGVYVSTGLSEKGYEKFKAYNSAYRVRIQLPAISDTGNPVYGFHSNSADGYDLHELLTEESAYIELGCPDSYTSFYGVKGNVPWYAQKLVSVQLNEGLEIIGNDAFRGCKGLTSIEIPSSVKEFGTNAFTLCENLKIDSFEIGGRSFGQSVFSGVSIRQITMSQEVAGVPTHSYDTGVFAGAQIKEVLIKEGVKQIANHTFRDCAMKEVSIAGTVESIGNDAFRGCKGLTSITIPSSVKEFGAGVFALCENLKLDSFEIGGKTFGQSVFSGVSIRQLTMSEEIAGTVYYSYEAGSFAGAQIEKVVIKEGVKQIANHTFRDCTMKEVSIAGTVESIGEEAFKGCKGLTSITIPSGVKNFGTKAFAECSNLKIDSFEIGGRSFGQSVFSGVRIPLLTMREEVAGVIKYFYESGSFAGAQIEEVVIKEGVKQIAKYTFCGCTMVEVSIAGTVEAIGEDVFSDCSNLQTIRVVKGSFAETWANNNGFSEILVLQ